MRTYRRAPTALPGIVAHMVCQGGHPDGDDRHEVAGLGLPNRSP
jgi:hypothetical protein